MPPEMKESPLDCNCPWLECAAHPDRLCSSRALVIECGPDCTNDHGHYLGDNALGKDIHLCRACAETIADIMVEEIPSLMAAFSAYVPYWMKPLEILVKHAYQAKIRRGVGWTMPQLDAHAVLALAYIVAVLEESGELPGELLDRLASTKAKVSSFTLAYNLGEKEIQVHE